MRGARTKYTLSHTYEKEAAGVQPVARNRKIAFFYDIDTVNPSGRNFRAILSQCAFSPLTDVAKWVEERCQRLHSTLEDMQGEAIEAAEDMDAVADAPSNAGNDL